MNRSDEIKAAALDVAQHVTQDPAKRDAMANDLITLVGLMIDAVGKCVAVDGESDLNDARTASFPWDDGSFEPTPELAAEAASERADDERNAYTRYLTGEALQRKADYVATEARRADLSRYATPVWRPRCPDCGERHVCRCTAHDPRCVGCGASQCDTRCTECNRMLRFGHMFNCSQRRTVAAAVAHCPECNRAEGDGHARGCRLTSCVAAPVAHDPRCVGCGEEGCNGSCCISF